MNQDNLFLEQEGNEWFNRNKTFINDEDRQFDFTLYLSNLITDKISKVIDLGCANGWRLNQLSKKLGINYCVGVDASLAAIEDGKQRYSHLNLYQGLISDVPLIEDFDLVIINFVLHWVDRQNLVKSIAEIDRLTKNNGFLIIEDFLPDFQQRRHYHHRPAEEIYTYKQDYAKIFTSFGIYKELARFTFNHDQGQKLAINNCDSSTRAGIVILKKSLHSYYPQII